MPRERFEPTAAGARWELPERQPEERPRERSIEHAMLTPVFGTTCPTRGLSGAVRRLAYARYSEGRAAHWLLLLAADRVDVVESAVRSWGTAQPDVAFIPSGLRGEISGHGRSSRVGQSRADVVHQTLDPSSSPVRGSPPAMRGTEPGGRCVHEQRPRHAPRSRGTA